MAPEIFFTKIRNDGTRAEGRNRYPSSSFLFLVLNDSDSGDSGSADSFLARSSCFSPKHSLFRRQVVR